MKRIAISQSNYLPWKGYFDLIASVDEFVLFDAVQYTRRDWRNRNKIKANEGSRWITVPVKNKGRYLQTISETLIDGDNWLRNHLAVVRHAYRCAPYFKIIYPWFESVLESAPRVSISSLNRHLVSAICDRLCITTTIRDCSEFMLVNGRTERLLEICLQLDASEYVSGPAAKSYLSLDVFAEHGVTVQWKSYVDYPEYPQQFPPFEHHVSIIDVLMYTGTDAAQYIRSARMFDP